MDEFKIIYVMNEAMIEVMKTKNEDYEENLKIKKILEDEASFFKIDKHTAYEILKKVGVKEEQLEKVYKKLIAPNIYYSLLSNRKIKVDDENLIIKYKENRK